VVWGGKATLSVIEDRPWMIKRNPSQLNQGLIKRSYWQLFCLSTAVRKEGCDVLFVLGGSYLGKFHPVVTMSQNLLPFEMSELKRYGWTFMTFKLLLLRFVQTQSFKKADGVIFLTEYTLKVVTEITGKLQGKTCIIPHGINPRFRKEPRHQYPIAKYNKSSPFHIIYISIIDQYKHQWHVVEAVAELCKQGYPIVLDLIGPAYMPALKRLNIVLDHLDAERQWVHYHGSIPFRELHLRYSDADLGVFASSCENMPNILLETMMSGLPIACSNRGPMPEVLGEAGVYFSPEQPEDIALAIRAMLESPLLRTKLANASYEYAQQYSWEHSADPTIKFLASFK
jgi:glycosyltransferase involved in cell wall biosynthesis